MLNKLIGYISVHQHAVQVLCLHCVPSLPLGYRPLRSYEIGGCSQSCHKCARVMAVSPSFAGDRYPDPCDIVPSEQHYPLIPLVTFVGSRVQVQATDWEDTSYNLPEQWEIDSHPTVMWDKNVTPEMVDDIRFAHAFGKVDPDWPCQTLAETAKELAIGPTRRQPKPRLQLLAQV